MPMTFPGYARVPAGVGFTVGGSGEDRDREQGRHMVGNGTRGVDVAVMHAGILSPLSLHYTGSYPPFPCMIYLLRLLRTLEAKWLTRR